MSMNHLVYPLTDGYIHNWLIAGPIAAPLSNTGRRTPVQTNGILPLARSFSHVQPVLSEPPVDQGTSEWNGEKLAWNYYRCHEDHFIDGSTYLPNWQHLHTWAYTEIKAQSALPITLVLTTSGPAALWLNGKLLHRQEYFSHTTSSTLIQAVLEQDNALLVCFEQVAVRECQNVMAIQITGLPSKEAEAGISVSIPTNARYPLRQQSLEQVFETAYLEEVVNHRGAHFNLGWSEDLKQQITYAYKILDGDNHNYLEGNWQSDTEQAADVGHTYRLVERPYFVTLTAPIKEQLEHNLRYQRQLPIHVLDDAYASTADSDLAQRQLQALESAAKYETDLFAEIAKMQLNRWSELNPALIQGSIDQVNRRDANSAVLLAGLLGILARYQSNPAFPNHLKQPTEACVLNFRYELGEPEKETLDFNCESQVVLLYTCQILAGQLFPKRVFTASHQKGASLCKQGEPLALDWIRQRCGAGFVDWNSNSSIEQVILALSTLTSLAKNESVLELAAVLLDKILLMLAVNSFKGAHGVSHGRTQASMIKSAQLEATSGISRLLWGLGVFNHHILGTVGLTCSNYEYPAFFADIATHLPEELLSKEQHATRQPGAASSGGTAGVNTVTYKTPDGMLSSAQDYCPGEKGSQEHIWQATMGPDAVVFTNHPACMSESEAHHPGFWLGNAVLPRVAQWKDVLVAVYNIPQDAWMGFTHAYFPTFAFDEHAFSDGWAFARKDQGYLAITAAHGFELIKRGPDGYRELRSYGRQNTWICQMGRAAKDGSFAAFQKRVMKMPVNFQEQAVQMTGLRGEKLAFGWHGPLIINGAEQPISGFKHIENPYCTADLPAKYLDIAQGEILMRLNFA